MMERSALGYKSWTLLDVPSAELTMFLQYGNGGREAELEGGSSNAHAGKEEEEERGFSSHSCAGCKVRSFWRYRSLSLKSLQVRFPMLNKKGKFTVEI